MRAHRAAGLPSTAHRWRAGSLLLLGLGGAAAGTCGAPPIYSRDILGGSHTGSTPMLPGDTSTGGSANTGGSTSPGTGSSAGGAGQPSTGGGPGTGGSVATGGQSTGGARTGGAPATGGTAPGGARTGGAPATGGVSTGGAATGGAATGGAATGGVSTGGVSTGGERTGGAGGGGVAGASGAAGSPGTITIGPAPAAIDCSAPAAPPGGLLTDFTALDPTNGRWAASNGLDGGRFDYHGGASSTAQAVFDTSKHSLHFTASVGAASWAGCGIILDACASLSASKSLRFAVSGTTTCAVEVQLQTFNQRPTTDAPAGGCASGTCISYAKVAGVAVGTSPVTIPLASFSNWSATLANQVVGVQWQVTNPATGTCTADLQISAVQVLP